jgi:RNA polymerase sigma factor (TIGR02999 family)
MTPQEIVEFDHLFGAWQAGDSQAASQLVALAYRDLRRLAGIVFGGRYTDNTMQPTAVANEVCLKILRSNPQRLNDRNHFFATAVLQMRSLLIDHYRTRPVEKRIGYRIDINEVNLPAPLSTPWNLVELIDLEEAMDQLGKIRPRARQIVELRYILGLSVEETAEVMGVSLATLKRDWVFAKGLLASLLGGAEGKITIRPPAAQRGQAPAPLQEEGRALHAPSPPTK